MAIILFSLLVHVLVFHISPLIVASQSPKDVTTDFIDCLVSNSNNSTAMSQIIFTHDSPSYYSVLYKFAQNLRYETPHTPQPLVILTPFLYSQIRTAISCSKKTGLQMRIRSGGHDFEGSSYVSEIPFFVLDTYSFRKISIDASSRIAWVGSGASLGELYYAINKTDPSLAFPGGYWLTVCIGGHISGGGFGPLVRKHGLAADHVLDAIVMDANGRVFDRKGMGEDFFWAIRGGVGSSFGIILSYKLKLVENLARISAFKVVKTVDKGATPLLHKWQHIAHKLPVEMTLAVGMKNINTPCTTETETVAGSRKQTVFPSTTDNEIEIEIEIETVNRNGRKQTVFPSTTETETETVGGSGKQTVQVTFVALFLGDINGIFSLITDTFPELGVTRNDCVELDYPEYFIYHFGFPIERTAYYLTTRIPPRPNTYFKSKSDFVQQPIPIEGLEKMWKLMTQVPPSKAQMRWIPFGGRNDEIDSSSIPFPHRAGNSFLVWENIEWNTTELSVARNRLEWMEKFYKLMGFYVADNPRRAYVDYTDNDLGHNNINGYTTVEQAKKWGKHYFLDNFDRLVRVKTQVDPQNFFRREQSIPVAVSSSAAAVLAF